MLDYTLKRIKNARRLTLRVTPDGGVIVTAPYFAPRWEIERFVASRQDWLARQLATRRQFVPTNGANYALFGRDYILRFAYEPQYKTGWHIVDGQLLYNNSTYQFLPKKEQKLTASENEKLADFARRTLRHYIDGRLPQLHARMQLPLAYRQVRIKNQATRWGSCSSDRNLNFNVNLVHFAPPVIDYVLIHELTHLVYPNHSAAFWALVAKYDGQYKLHRQQLNH